jgi:hypothetical protein
MNSNILINSHNFQVIDSLNEPVVEKTMRNNNTKKVTIQNMPQGGIQNMSNMPNMSNMNAPSEKSEDKEAFLKEYYAKFMELKKDLAEKKEKTKKIMNLTKLHERLYTKMENFNNVVPNLVEKYLENYQRTLDDYEKIMDLDDLTIDEVIEQNQIKIEKIREKFKF